MSEKTLHRNFFQRLLGICQTKQPLDSNSWILEKSQIIIDLDKMSELSQPDSAVRLELDTFPNRILVIHTINDDFFAFRNKCTHAKRRMDHIPGTDQVQCCSIGKSTFSKSGKIVSGSAKKPIITYQIKKEENQLIIEF
ncbi:MAG: Rieske 2Fe-2S domain-containing protein [Deltaproteobacteria bacterium]|jgi:nitrite reductase/ring-hydroxylating ferredoxin subunit|nr:Rieske 2Fe-2S domain-containing protein [Deltaproteobacteria bacterium]MBT4527304.1 Rieske 2Fe-2S domain-containing protein [Deltaproteobacteria bacterium]